jgi:hypothetical protein
MISIPVSAVLDAMYSLSECCSESTSCFFKLFASKDQSLVTDWSAFNLCDSKLAPSYCPVVRKSTALARISTTTG